MAINSLDGIIAGMKAPQYFYKVGATMEAISVQHSFFHTAGMPAAAPTIPSGLPGTALVSYSGQIPFSNPPAAISSGTYLARLEASTNVAGTLYLCDRLWHNAGIIPSITTFQTINSATLPNRDLNGNASGVNVFAALEASTAIGGAAVTTTTITYTNSEGVPNHTGVIPSWPATAAAGTFVPFTLQVGDNGIQSIQQITLGTTYATGNVHLVLYRVIARIPVNTANVSSVIDSLTGGFPQLYDDSVLFFVWRPTATTAITLDGSLVYTQG